MMRYLYDDEGDVYNAAAADDDGDDDHGDDDNKLTLNNVTVN